MFWIIADILAFGFIAVLFTFWYRQTQANQRQAQETHRISRNEVHTLREELQAAGLKITLLENQLAAVGEKPSV